MKLDNFLKVDGRTRIEPSQSQNLKPFFCPPHYSSNKLWPRGQVQAIFIKKLFLEHIHPLPPPFLWVLSMAAFMLTKAELRSYNRDHMAIKPEVFSIRFFSFRKIDWSLFPTICLRVKRSQGNGSEASIGNQPEPTVRNNSLCQPIQDSVGWWKENVALEARSSLNINSSSY